MTNPLTSREAPDPMTLTGFSPKAQQELERNKFAAVTGGLVNVSARTYWELHYAAIAWHEHLSSPVARCSHRIADARNPIVKSGYICVDCGALFSAADHDARRSPLSAQASDTQGDEA